MKCHSLLGEKCQRKPKCEHACDLRVTAGPGFAAQFVTPNPTTPDQGDERRALPPLDPQRILPYSAIRYVAGYPEDYVLEYATACTQELRDALKRLVEVYDAMGNPRGPALIAAEAALAAPQPSQGIDYCAPERIKAWENAAPHQPVSADAGKGVNPLEQGWPAWSPDAVDALVMLDRLDVRDDQGRVDAIEQCVRRMAEALKPSESVSGAVSDEREEDAYVIQRISTLLAQIAVIVRGQEPPRRRWGYSDLPERVLEMLNDRDALMVALRNLVTSIKERHNLDEAVIWAEEAISKSAARAVLALAGSGGK